MKKKIVKRILSIALAASMILGNVGVPPGSSTVKAEAIDVSNLTKVTDEEINNLYHSVSYKAQSVHDPSIIKKGDEYYVFGSHRGVAKTSNLTEWSSVNIDGLFGDENGKVLAPAEAFVNNLFHSEINVLEDIKINEASERKATSEDMDSSMEQSTEESSIDETAEDLEDSSQEETSENSEETSESESSDQSGEVSEDKNSSQSESSKSESSDQSEETSESKSSDKSEEAADNQVSELSEEVRESSENKETSEEAKVLEKNDAEEAEMSLQMESTEKTVQRTSLKAYASLGEKEATLIKAKEAETEEAETKAAKTEEAETKAAKTEEAETKAAKTEEAETEEAETKKTETESTTETERAESEETATQTEKPDAQETTTVTENENTEETEIEDVSTEEETEEALETGKKAAAKTVKENKETETQAAGTVTFGDFDAHAWSMASDGWTIDGNMWAPDVIYNETMQKYCMYLSLNGEYHNSVVILLTSEKIEGPYAYQGPVVYSGFTAEENTPVYYKDTDIEYVLGELTELPERYQQLKSIELDADGKITSATDTWGDYWPHAIDPAVFYDSDGNLWLIYGSWSGGIFALELDEDTGLRDYTISYESDFDTKGKNVTSDPYFGTKIAGGYYNSGEGPYIEKIGDYYYLFMSYGFYAPNGGYSMRVFRAKNPNGPYVDTKETSAIYDKGIANFIASYAQDVSQIDTRGMRLMTYYQWDHMSKGEVAQGHNSAFFDDDGRAYVFYHTKFNDNTAGHELRVHELFQNKNGWIVASPFAFANDAALNYDKEPENVAGDYEIIIGDYSLGYDKDSGDGKQDGNYTGPLAEIKTVSLTSDGKVVQGENEIGTWSVESQKAYATLTLNSANYSGVFAEVTKDSAGLKTMCFTGVDEATGITLWGARKLDERATIADNVFNPCYTVPAKVYGTFTLPTKGTDGVTLQWESMTPEIVSDDGIIKDMPEEDTEVTFKMQMIYGAFYYEKPYTITIAGTNSLIDGKYLVGDTYTNDPQDLSSRNNGSLSMVNPFYISNTMGMDLSGGVSIEFDAAHKGAVDVLGALFGFNDSGSGKLYFTQGSYLGYNATGGYYDANLKGYETVRKDYIKEAIETSGKSTAHIVINLSLNGFSVYVDDVLAYDQSIITTENGSGTLKDFSNVLEWLQSSASTLYFGFGAWWPERAANAEISNMKFYVNQSDANGAVDSVIEALKQQIPSTTKTDLKLPTEGNFSTTIQWKSSHEDIIAPDGTVNTPSKQTNVTLTATVSKGNVSKTVEFVVTVELPATSNAVIEKELLEITANDYIEYMDNPFYGKNLDNLIVDYNITFTKDSAKNGWDGIFAFYNSKTTGRVSFQTNPYICYNNGAYLDINHPDKNALAGNYEVGKPYHVKLVIGKDDCRIYINEELAIYMDEKDSESMNVCQGSVMDFAEVLNFVSECDKFTWGVGKAETSYWWTEICTLKDVHISSNEYQSNITEEVSLETEPTEMENPLYGMRIKEVVLDFTVNFSETAAMNGWDGLLAFYQPSEGKAGGRVSIQTAPYICFNNDDGTWIDINNPNNLTAANMKIPVTELSKGVDYHYYISICASEVTMKINDTPVELNEASSSASVSYQDILDFISTCEKFSWGVKQGVNCFWGMEKCTLKDAKVMGYYTGEYDDGNDDKNDEATVTFHYPDGTTKEVSINVNTKLTQPEFEDEDENGKFGIKWYTDETHTIEYDFAATVSGDMNLYGKYYYYDEEIKNATITLHYPDGTTRQLLVVVGNKAVLLEDEGEDENGKYGIKWYTDEAQTILYDVETAVTKDMDLYGKQYYYDTEIKSATITLHYPDGTTKQLLVVIGDKAVLPEDEGEDANGRYGIKWYTDEAQTILYDVDAAVTKDMDLYGKRYYHDVEIKSATVTMHYPDGSTKQVLVAIGDKVTEPDFEAEDANGKYRIKWYTDEAKTKLYDFDTAVMADMNLYGGLYYIDEGVESITVDFHYPDGTVKQILVHIGDKVVQPEFESEDANGRYGIIWYADEARTKLYDFNSTISENTSLYGSYYYYYEDTSKDPEGPGETVKTGIHVGVIGNQEYTGKAIKPAVVVYDGTTILTEKKDYKVSYTNNKKVGDEAKVTITPCGNYEKASKFTILFKIVPRELTKENVTISYKPEINVKYNSKKEAVGQTQKVTLKQGTLKVPTKDYTVAYQLNGEAVDKLTEAGTYQMMIKTNDNSCFNANLIYDVVVTDKILTSSLKIKAAAQNYTGNALTTDLQVTYKNKNVEQLDGKDLEEIFDIVYADNIKAGTASVTLTAKADSNYCGSKTATFKINGKAMKDVAIDGFQTSLPYTGEEITQNITLTLDKGKGTERKLTEGIDYEVSYSNNINVGKAVMTITGLGEFTGSVNKPFTVGKINLKQAGSDAKAAFKDTTGALTVVQDKSGATPEITVTYKGKVLEPNVDYTAVYSNNKAIGSSAKVTVKGIGNYTGEMKKVLTFAITEKEISDESISIVAADMKYAANGRYKTKLTIYDNGVKLTAKEYQAGAIENVTLDKDDDGNETQCGTAEITVTGMKNYTGTKKVTVLIKKTLISSAKITVKGNYYYANGDEITTTADQLTVTIGGNELIPDKDYIIDVNGYSNNTKAGKATLTIRGIGEYGGTKSVKFKILPKWMKK